MKGPSVLLIHRYYHPDAPPYAHMLRTMSHWLIEAGYDVTVLSAQPSYNDATASIRLPTRVVQDDVTVMRLPTVPERKNQMVRRAFNHLWFLARALWIIARRHDDLVTCSTMPPILMGATVRIALRLSRRRGRYIYHCQDLYPEALSAYDEAHPPWWIKALGRVDTQTVREAAATVVLSRDMAETLRVRGVSEGQIHIINNFPLVERESLSHELPPNVAGAFATDKTVLLFAGNIGRFQGLNTVVDAFLASSSQARLVFMGDGALRHQLEARVAERGGQDRVRFVGYQTPEIAMAAIARADHGLVSLRPGVTRVAYPSKTTAYLSAGTPLLIIADPGSALVTELAEADVATCVSPHDPVSLQQALSTLSPTLPARRHSIQEFADATFGHDTAKRRWSLVFNELTQREVATR